MRKISEERETYQKLLNPTPMNIGECSFALSSFLWFLEILNHEPPNNFTR
jgi:hypothetical protein